MKDISPSRRAVLERAANHVQVYERIINENHDEPVLFAEGCFECEHPISNMSGTGRYNTVFFSLTDSNNEDYDDDEDNNILSVVVNLTDAFWLDKSHWLLPPLDELNSYNFFPEYYRRQIKIKHVLENPFISARITKSLTEGYRHVNSVIDLRNVFYNLADYEFIQLQQSGSLRGVYFDPNIVASDVFDPSPSIVFEDVRVAETVSLTTKTRLISAYGLKKPEVEYVPIHGSSERKIKMTSVGTTMPSYDIGDSGHDDF